MKNYKIAVAGTGYVGLSLGVLLSQHHQVVAVDIVQAKVDMINNKKSPITEKTKVICPVHYAGVACEMDTIMDIAKKHNLMVVEDAAQGVMSTYKGRALGTIGDFGCYSFHETKNYSMGEGGAIVINNPTYIEKAEILREKGTNRSQFFRGQVAKYNWVDFGDSYLQSDLNAAYLWAQLEVADEINEDRLVSWNNYYQAFSFLEDKGIIELPTIPEDCTHNGARSAQEKAILPGVSLMPSWSRKSLSA